MLRHITVDRIHEPVDIYANDDSRIYASFLGTEGIHKIGSCMSCEPIGVNQFKVSDGVASVQGRMAIIDPGTSELLTSDIGVSGYNRIDLIVLDFITDGEDETITLQIVKGKQATTPIDPQYVQEDLTKGGTHRQVPLWRIRFEGTLIKTVERYNPIIENLQSLTNVLGKLLTTEIGSCYVTIPNHGNVLISYLKMGCIVQYKLELVVSSLIPGELRISNSLPFDAIFAIGSGGFYVDNIRKGEFALHVRGTNLVLSSNGYGGATALLGTVTAFIR